MNRTSTSASTETLTQRGYHIIPEAFSQPDTDVSNFPLIRTYAIGPGHQPPVGTHPVASNGLGEALTRAPSNPLVHVVSLESTPSSQAEPR